MANKPIRIYWDSCVYIDCIQRTPGRHDVLDEIVAEAKNNKIVLVASALVLAEVSKLEGLNVEVAEQTRQIRAFFENDFISMRNVTRRVAEDAADFGRQYSIKPADAVHVATALHYKCVSFQTYDGKPKRRGRLLALDGKIGNPPLKIEVPRVVEAGDSQGQKRMW